MAVSGVETQPKENHKQDQLGNSTLIISMTKEHPPFNPFSVTAVCSFSHSADTVV